MPFAVGHAMLVPDETCSGLARVHHYVAYAGEFQSDEDGWTAAGQGYVIDGNVEDCDLDGTPGDYDGEPEFGVGTAVLAAGAGSLECLGIYPHHSPYVAVDDANDDALGIVAYAIGVDHSLVPPVIGYDCGDGIIEPNVNPADRMIHCATLIGIPCYLEAMPGADGAYWVFMEPLYSIPTWGHIETSWYDIGAHEGYVPVPAEPKQAPAGRSYEQSHVYPW